MVSFYSMFLTTRTKVGMMRQTYNGIDRITFGANVKQFTYKTKKKNKIMSIVRQCKKQHHVIFLSVNSATKMFLLPCQVITAHNSVFHSPSVSVSEYQSIV